MNTLLLMIFKVLHVFGGALWVSVVVYNQMFISPTLQVIGVDSLRFNQALDQKNRFTRFMGLIATGTILSGFLFYYLYSGGLKWGWITSGTGIAFSLGALAGIGAFLIGGFGIGRITAQLKAASAELAAQGKTPKPKLVSRIKALESTFHFYETLDFWFLVVAMLLMITARFWKF